MSKAEKLKSKRSQRSLGGRPRVNMAPRDPSGGIAKAARKPKETQEQILAVALAQPHRRYLLDGRSPMAGYAGGRLHLMGKITKPQLAMLNRYTLLSLRYMRIKMGRLPRFPCLALERQDRGLDSLPDLASEDVREIEDAHADALMVIPSAAVGVLLRVGVMEDDITDLNRLDVLTTALDRLGRLWDNEDALLTRPANGRIRETQCEHSRQFTSVVGF